MRGRIFYLQSILFLCYSFLKIINLMSSMYNKAGILHQDLIQSFGHFTSSESFIKRFRPP
jgi:hypothetical protein